MADLGKQIAGLEALAKRTGSRLYGYSVRDGHARGMFEDRPRKADPREIVFVEARTLMSSKPVIKRGGLAQGSLWEIDAPAKPGA